MIGVFIMTNSAICPTCGKPMAETPNQNSPQCAECNGEFLAPLPHARSLILLHKETLTDNEWQEASERLYKMIQEARENRVIPAFKAPTLQAMQRHFAKTFPANLESSYASLTSYLGICRHRSWAFLLASLTAPAELVEKISLKGGFSLDWEFFWGRSEIKIDRRLLAALINQPNGREHLQNFLTSFHDHYLASGQPLISIDPALGRDLQAFAERDNAYHETRRKLNWLYRDAYKKVPNDLLLSQAIHYFLNPQGLTANREWLENITLLCEILEQDSAQNGDKYLKEFLRSDTNWWEYLFLAIRDEGYVSHDRARLIASFPALALSSLPEETLMTFTSTAIDLLKNASSGRGESYQLLLASLASVIEWTREQIEAEPMNNSSASATATATATATAKFDDASIAALKHFYEIYPQFTKPIAAKATPVTRLEGSLKPTSLPPESNASSSNPSSSAIASPFLAPERKDAALQNVSTVQSLGLKIAAEIMQAKMAELMRTQRITTPEGQAEVANSSSEYQKQASDLTTLTTSLNQLLVELALPNSEVAQKDLSAKITSVLEKIGGLQSNTMTLAANAMKEKIFNITQSGAATTPDGQAQLAAVTSIYQERLSELNTALTSLRKQLAA
jgi:hypothetical protein